MKPEKSGIVERLKRKHAEGLARANTQNGAELFSADISLFQKWAYRVGKGWYGFSLGDIPSVWCNILDDFLVWVESQCPDFEIHQIKMKVGELRFYIETHCDDVVVNEKMRSEISKLEALLHHEHLR